MMDEISVFAWLDTKGCIVRLESSIFYSGNEHSLVLDKGTGDKYAHCQSNYLEDGLVDSNGNPNYKYVEGEGAVKLTEAEKAELYPSIDSEPVDEPEKQDDILVAQLVAENARMNKKLEEQDELIAQLLEQSAKGGIN